ncbi:oxygenase MpaB family protein [Streptomyces sp. NPDC058401]|uniref:oxygenase MpaB family protein n=1 Tax=Streptomyces sp. NPDC058401 TaxID=3346480 RepID=UPI0036624865
MPESTDSKDQVPHWVTRAQGVADHLADDLVEELRNGGKQTRDDLQHGLAHGARELTRPSPALAAFLHDLEHPPAHLDPDVLDRGSQAWFIHPGWVHAIALSAGSLVKVYRCPSIAAALAATGSLVNTAGTRLDATGLWVNSALLPGALHPGKPGYIATAHVRLVHARARLAALANGYDPAVHGSPINQADLLRTWLAFTHTSFRAEAMIGYTWTESELAVLYRYWQHIAHLMGIEPHLVAHLTGPAAAAEADRQLAGRSQSPAAPEADVLTHQTIEAVAETLEAQVKLSAAVGRPLLRALVTRFHAGSPDRSLPARPLQSALAALRPVVRLGYRWQSRPARRAALITENLALTRAYIHSLDAHRPNR